MRATFRHSLIGLAILVITIGMLSLHPHKSSASATAGPITGYAWSDTIGWIDLNCSNDNSCGTNNYGLTVDSSGNLSGYAWSDNIGWISASASDVVGCPSGTCQPTLVHGVLSGWLKAIAADNNGWDGWISLSGSGYGPTVSSGVFSGYAWGSDVVGWVDWSQARTTFNDACTPSYSCSGQTIQYTNSSCQVSNVTTCTSPAFCEAGSTICLYPTISFNTSGSNLTGHLQLIPNLIRSGATTTVDWSVSNAQSCSVQGTNGDSWNGLSGSYSSKSVTSQTTYTLSCLAYGSNPGVDEMQIVNVVPVFKEF